MSAFSLVDGFGLDPKFVEPLNKLLMTMRAKGHDFRIAQGLRTPQKQAEYYCRWVKRPPAKIDAAADDLIERGAPWLAGVLRSSRDIKRSPNWLTSQLPGGGWHQWGLAADCYCYVNGKQVTTGNDARYKLYADEAVKLGLTAGFYFSKQDSGHVQLPSAAGAADMYTWAFIDKTMQERFADKQRVALAGTPPTD